MCRWTLCGSSVRSLYIASKLATQFGDCFLMLCKYTFFTKITKYYLGGKGRVTIQNTMYLGIVAIMIHQISCLAPDWSKHTTWSINLQLKHPSNIPQFSNLLRYGKSSFHIKLETREGFVVVREERTFFCSLSRTREHSKENVPHFIQ